MRIKLLIITAVIITFACQSTAARGENDAACVTAGEDWSWESGAHDLFEGTIDLSEFTGQELTIRMSSDLPYNEDEQSGRPVFVTVNDSRITMMKQSNTIRCTPSVEEPVVRFSARLILPEKQRVYGITFQFTVSDESNHVLKTVQAAISGGDSGAGSAFYISADIRRIAVCIGIAAAAVWIAAVFRAVYFTRKKRTGE